MPAPPAGPHRRLGRDGHGRPDVVPARPHDRDARPGEPRPALVPRGERPAEPQGRHRRRPARGRPTVEAAAVAERASAHRSGRDDGIPPARDPLERQPGRLHRRPTTCPSSARTSTSSTRRLERHVVVAEVVRRGAEQGDHALGRARHPRDRRRGDRARHRGQRPVRGPGHAGRRGHRGRHRRDDHGPLHAGRHDGRRDDPGHARRLPADAREDDGAGPLDAAGRRRGRRSSGSRPPTRRWSGARPSASSTRSSRSLAGAWRT